MLNKLKISFINFWIVFSKIKYIIMAITGSFLFYLLNFFIANISNILNFYRIRGLKETIPFIYNLFISFKGSILPSSFFTIVVLSSLTGVLLGLMAYKMSLRKNIPVSFLGGLGMFLGIFAPGCTACGLGLAAFFGLATSFATLPLKGLEVSILASGILIISIFRFSYTLRDNVCYIDSHKRKTERGG